jgi:tRNA 2-selenouridine synthase
MIHRISIEELIQLSRHVADRPSDPTTDQSPRPSDLTPALPARPPSARLPVLDVRSPAEFAQGHIPLAGSLPLFSNEERALVGTTYKKEGKEKAILLGFDLAGPKWSGFVRQALELAPEKKVVLHCWRGGMRSGAMAWALDLYGFDVYLLDGGYKRYRKWVLGQFEKEYRLMVIGGKTGSGKTRILQQLDHLGEQVIDLEDIAQHRGSSYGSMNSLIQPSQEQMENILADWLSKLDPQKRTWVEDESSNIGKRMIPRPFWNQIRKAPLVDLLVDFDQRVKALVTEYGSLDKEFLVECTDRIRKRVGTEHTKNAIAAIREDRMDEFIRLVLVYYDKTYLASLKDRDPARILAVAIAGADPLLDAQKILDAQRIPSPQKITG